MRKTQGEIKELAFYPLQLFYIANMYRMKTASVYLPKKIPYTFINNYNEKLAIEMATSYYYASDHNRISLSNNLQKYCKDRGLEWILRLIID
jgi:hypothetical protein